MDMWLGLAQHVYACIMHDAVVVSLFVFVRGILPSAPLLWRGWRGMHTLVRALLFLALCVVLPLTPFSGNILGSHTAFSPWCSAFGYLWFMCVGITLAFIIFGFLPLFLSTCTSGLAPTARTLLGDSGQATLNFAVVPASLFVVRSKGTAARAENFYLLGTPAEPSWIGTTILETRKAQQPQCHAVAAGDQKTSHKK